MRKSKLFSAQVKVAVVLAFLALMMVVGLSCGKLLPTAPDAKSGSVTEQDWGAPCNPISPGDLPFEWTELSSQEDAAWFGTAGGTMTQVIDCVMVQFRVPPQALDASVYITVQSTLMARNLDGKVYKKLELVFDPDGQVFSTPATLMFGTTLLGSKEGDQLTLRWFNPETQSWEVVQKVMVVPGMLMVTFNISHFSRYAISTSVQPSLDR
jgi:hypothetical protein